MTDRTLLQQAVEALKSARNTYEAWGVSTTWLDCVAASLETALQQQPEPVAPSDEEIVAWVDTFIRKQAYNYPVAVQIATEAAKWVRSRAAPPALQQQEELREADGDGPIRNGWQVSVGPGHDGFGVYAHMTDYPEEGAVCICTIDPTEYPEASPSPKEKRTEGGKEVTQTHCSGCGLPGPDPCGSLGCPASDADAASSAPTDIPANGVRTASLRGESSGSCSPDQAAAPDINKTDDVPASAAGWVEAGLVCQACAGDAPAGKCRNPKCAGGSIVRELVPAARSKDGHKLIAVARLAQEVTVLVRIYGGDVRHRAEFATLCTALRELIGPTPVPQPPPRAATEDLK